MIGTSLGPYKIIEQLGAGGMGEVYLGEDTRLGRKVAVKVLPEEYASDPERLARFEQEARAAAALNHPHIAVVHDIGFAEGSGDATAEAKTDPGLDPSGVLPASGVHYIVQEYLEGETVGDALRPGRLPLKKALDLATEVAEALAAAHGAGIIHRDLKPANIFITDGDHAKVLDFGLAKLTEMAAVGRADDGVSKSPTLLGTVAGQVMGTAGYMAPEQVEGTAEIDHRADVFAFGCLLYEMVTGSQAFSGTSVLDTLHRIAHSQPRQLAEIDAELPAEIQRIVGKCLAKEPSARYQHADDLIVDLRGLAMQVETGTAVTIGQSGQSAPLSSAGAPGGSGTGSESVGGEAGGGVSRKVAAGLVVAVGLLAAAGGTVIGRGTQSVSEARVVRFVQPLAEGLQFGAGMAVSPDGTTLVYSAFGPEGLQLFRRSIHEFDDAAIPGTEGGLYPFFSSDGEWIGFSTGRELKRVRTAGGEPFRLASVEAAALGSWGDDNRIVFEVRDALFQVAGTGGDPVAFAAPEDDTSRETPWVLPGSRAALVGSEPPGTSTSGIGVIDLESGEFTELIGDGVDPQYVATGHIIYARTDGLWAQAFDPERLAVQGAPFPVQQGVLRRGNTAQFALGEDGTLVYGPGGEGEGDGSRLVFLNRSGEAEPVSDRRPGDLATPRMSPDEQQIAVVEIEDTEPAIWIYDIARRTFQPFASGGRNPAWTPDGETIYFSMRGDADYDIYRRPADSSGPAEIVLAREHNQFVTGLSPDGRFLLFEENHPETNLDAWLLPIDGGDPEGLLTEPYVERGGVFSPDGNWIAYSANPAGGPAEVFVRPYPGPGRTQQISNNQGDQPVWSRNGTELWYGSAPGRLWIVPISLDNQFEAGVPELALPRALESPRWGTSSDATGDGRVVTSDANLRSLDAAAFAGVNVVVNWFHELRRLDEENR